MNLYKFDGQGKGWTVSVTVVVAANPEEAFQLAKEHDSTIDFSAIFDKPSEAATLLPVSLGPDAKPGVIVHETFQVL